MKRQPKLIRYVSPFGSPAWMTKEEAQRYLEEDDRLYLEFHELGVLSERERQIGPPRIEGRDA